jgi:hypothetical protein
VNMRLTVASATATILASIALYPLLQGGTWFWAGTGAVIVVAAIGAATRRRAIPAIVCFLAMIAGEFVYLNVLYARHWSGFGLLPTGSSVHHLRLLVAQATAETSKFAPAVPDRPGIVMLTAAGIGLVGALTDVLAVRLHRPAIAGLPLLVLFCVPLTTDAKTGAVGGTLVFCAGVVGYLGLLSADGRHRLRLWGRLVHPWRDETETMGPDIRPLTAAGRRIGSAAVVLALSLPLLIPGLRQHRLFPGTGGNGTGGYHGQISFPRPLDALNAQLRENHPLTVLTYRTKESQPPYLQVYVLDRLGSNAWTMAAPTDATALTHGNVPQAAGVTATTPGPAFQEQIRLGNLKSNGNVSYLPLPYAARRVQASGSWRVDAGTMTVFAANAQLAGMRYTVTGKDPNPSPAVLRVAGQAPVSVAQDLFVPHVFRDLTKLARQITKGRTTEYGRAVALQNWFTKPGNFTYTLDVPRTNSPSDLEQFLTKTRRGYCQQFAFAMAVLARLVHIPARVVIGYTQGTVLGDNTWQVKTSDAHAWPELYFAGTGWLRFEPTPSNPAGLPGQATAAVPAYSLPFDTTVKTNPETGQPIQTNPDPQGNPSKHSKQSLPGKLTGAKGGAGGAGAAHKKSPAPIAALAIILLAILLIAPGTVRLLTRRWRWLKAGDAASRAHVAWRELHDDLTDYRIPSRGSESPRALAQRMAQSLSLGEAERGALRRIALAEERASYAASPPEEAQLRADSAQVRRAISRRSGVRARVAARIMPTSVLVPAREGLQHLLDVFGWMELAATKVRRAALRRSHPART